MLRTVATGRPRAASLLSMTVAQQKRRKHWIRKEGEDFYTLNRQGPDLPRVPEQHELFSISPFLLDLDDVDCKGVRPYNRDDEAAIGEKWLQSPTQRVAQMRAEHIQDEVAWLRGQAEEASREDRRQWRLGHHDVLTAAIHGPPDITHLSYTDSLETTESAYTRHSPRTAQHFNPLLYMENGVASHAFITDSSLLQWLTMRQHDAAASSANNNTSKSMLSEAVKQQTTVAGVRRLVAQSLPSMGKRTSNDFFRGNDVSLDIRDALVYALSQSRDKAATGCEILDFLGNMKCRFSPHDDNLDPALSGLGLAMSGVIGHPDCTMAYFDSFVSQGMKDSYQYAMDDVMQMLQAYNHHFQNGSPGLADVEARRTLFELVQGTARTGSLRYLIIDFFAMSEDSLKQAAVGLYKSYISLLGHLGAVNVLWKEWQLTGSRLDVQGSEEQSAIAHADVHDGPGVTEVFYSAIAKSLSIIAPGDEVFDRSEETLMASCMIADHAGIEMQDRDVWLNGQPDKALPFDEAIGGEIRAALAEPVDRCMERIKRCIA